MVWYSVLLFLYYWQVQFQSFSLRVCFLWYHDNVLFLPVELVLTTLLLSMSWIWYHRISFIPFSFLFSSIQLFDHGSTGWSSNLGRGWDVLVLCRPPLLISLTVICTFFDCLISLWTFFLKRPSFRASSFTQTFVSIRSWNSFLCWYPRSPAVPLLPAPLILNCQLPYWVFH